MYSIFGPLNTCDNRAVIDLHIRTQSVSHYSGGISLGVKGSDVRQFKTNRWLRGHTQLHLINLSLLNLPFTLPHQPLVPGWRCIWPMVTAKWGNWQRLFYDYYGIPSPNEGRMRTGAWRLWELTRETPKTSLLTRQMALRYCCRHLGQLSSVRDVTWPNGL